MKNLIKYISIFILPVALLLSCEDESYEFGDISAPGNLQVVIDIVGSDVNPAGDGSGDIHITANAAGAINYKIALGSSEKYVASGEASFTVDKTGTFEYNITVTAYGRGGASSTMSETVEVYLEYEPPAEVIAFLTNNSSKTWRVASELTGHLGVGPASSYTKDWWSAAPEEKAGIGVYDDRMTFNVDGTIDYVTNGDIWGKAEAMDPEIGVTGVELQAFGEYHNYPFDDFTDTWAITEPGGKLTLTFGEFGFGGMYVGSNPNGVHGYEIIDMTDNTMELWIVAAEGNAWYVTLIAVE